MFKNLKINFKLFHIIFQMTFPDGSAIKNLPEKQEMWVQSLSGRSPGGGHYNPLQYSCLENPVNRGVWWATVHKVAKSWTQLKQLGTHADFRYG